MGNRHSGSLLGRGLLAPQGLGQQQGSQCKQPNKKQSSDKSSPVGKTKNIPVQRRPVCMSTASAIRILPLVWQEKGNGDLMRCHQRREQTTSTPWDQAMTVHFSLGRLWHWVTPNRAQCRGAEGPQPAQLSTMVIF